MRCDQITSCTYSHSCVRVAGGELNPQWAARTAAAQTVARPPLSWGQTPAVCLVQERAVASWSVGCLAWQVASARREWHQHHRTNRRRTKAKLRLSVTPHGPRRPRKGSSRAVSAQFVLQSEVGTPTRKTRSSNLVRTKFKLCKTSFAVPRGRKTCFLRPGEGAPVGEGKRITLSSSIAHHHHHHNSQSSPSRM